MHRIYTPDGGHYDLNQEDYECFCNGGVTNARREELIQESIKKKEELERWAEANGHGYSDFY